MGTKKGVPKSETHRRAISRALKGRVKRSVEDRLASLTDKTGPIPVHRPELGPCWLWLGKLNEAGYGIMEFKNERPYFRRAHRVSYETLKEPIPAGLVLDHLCSNRACVNPTHLEPVTQTVNAARGLRNRWDRSRKYLPGRGQKVYLAGAITGLSYAGAVDWRERVKKELEHVGYICFSPMRGKEALKDVTCFTPFGYELEQGGATNHNIYRRDNYDVHRADIVLVNLAGATRVSIGTMFEIAWAQQAGKFVLTIIDDETNPHNHAFVYEGSSMIVKSVDDAVRYLRDVLNA